MKMVTVGRYDYLTALCAAVVPIGWVFDGLCAAWFVVAAVASHDPSCGEFARQSNDNHTSLPAPGKILPTGTVDLANHSRRVELRANLPMGHSPHPDGGRFRSTG